MCFIFFSFFLAFDWQLFINVKSSLEFRRLIAIFKWRRHTQTNKQTNNDLSFWFSKGKIYGNDTAQWNWLFNRQSKPIVTSRRPNKCRILNWKFKPTHLVSCLYVYALAKVNDKNVSFVHFSREFHRFFVHLTREVRIFFKTNINSSQRTQNLVNWWQEPTIP